MSKKILLFAVLLLGLLPSFASAADLNLYFFRGEGCPHCAKEEIFLEELKAEYPALRVHDFEIYYDAANARLMREVGRALRINASGVPLTIIGDRPFVGFSESLSPELLRERVAECSANTNNCPDSVAAIVGLEPAGEPSPVASTSPVTRRFVVPLLGEIDAARVSLPLLTVVLGVLDGFNPCALWTLVFLISLLLGMASRRRMWLLGGVFIVTSAAVYFLFMAAWLNLMLLIGALIWVRLLIGLVALGGGAYQLKEFFQNPGNICKVTNDERRQKVFAKLRALAGERSLWLALAGIILLAAAVNLVELLCSAGLPAVYTQVLALNNLPGWQYYAYLLLYIFFFMLDDLAIFIVAMITLRLTGLSGRYTRATKLIGGVLMVVIGLLLILRPEWLLFG